jgi:microcystin-dependent protein
MTEPIGSIIAYGGEIDPKPIRIAGGSSEIRKWENDNGWLICDGREFPIRDFQPLFAAIGMAWGGNMSAATFYLPSLQGLFLRGLDPIASVEQRKDKEADARTAIRTHQPSSVPVGAFAGNTGAKVGSFQDSATALPKKPFQTASFDQSDPDKTNPTGVRNITGRHKHVLDFQLDASRRAGGSTDNTVAYPSSRSQGVQHATDAPFLQPVGDGGHQHEINLGGDKETHPVNAYIHWIIRYK